MSAAQLPAELPSCEGADVRRATTRLLRSMVRISTATMERLDRCLEAARARFKGEVLQGELTRSAIVRAAVAVWFEETKNSPLDVVYQAIRAALCSERCLCRRRQFWAPEMVARLDKLASAANKALHRKVKRAVVVRVALAASWLDDATPPEAVIQAIRESLVKRGRKPSCRGAREIN